MYSQTLRQQYERSDPQGYNNFGRNNSTPNAAAARNAGNLPTPQSNRPPLPRIADQRGTIYNSFTTAFHGQDTSASRRDPPPSSEKNKRVVFSRKLENHEKYQSHKAQTPTTPILRRSKNNLAPTPTNGGRQSHSRRDPTPRSAQRISSVPSNRKTISDILNELTNIESEREKQLTSSDPPVDRSRRPLYSPAAKSPRDIFSKMALRNRATSHSDTKIVQKKDFKEPEPAQTLLDQARSNQGAPNASWDIADLFPSKLQETNQHSRQELCVMENQWRSPQPRDGSWNQNLPQRSPGESSTESQDACLIGNKASSSSDDIDIAAPSTISHAGHVKQLRLDGTPTRTPGIGERRDRKLPGSGSKRIRVKERFGYAQLEEEEDEENCSVTENMGTEVVLVPSNMSSESHEKPAEKFHVMPNHELMGGNSIFRNEVSGMHIAPQREFRGRSASNENSVGLKQSTSDTSNSDSVPHGYFGHNWQAFDPASSDNDDFLKSKHRRIHLTKKLKILWMIMCLLLLCLCVCLPVYYLKVVKKNYSEEGSGGRSFLDCVDEIPDPSLYSERYAEMRRVVMGSSSGYTFKVDEPGSSQRKALCWISDLDEAISITDGNSIPAIVQRYTLAVLYYSLVQDDDGSRRSLQNSDFLSSSHECEWSAVMCGKPGSVTALLLADKLLTGSLPMEIADLRHLSFLELSLNNLTGEIPTSIENLTMLEYLAVAFNSFSGTIPSEIGSLTNLEFLNLRSSKVNGRIPTEIGRLEQLHTLLIEGNWLTGTIPATLGNLKSAQQMSFRRNYITGKMPQEVCELRAISLAELRVDSWLGCDCCTA